MLFHNGSVKMTVLLSVCRVSGVNFVTCNSFCHSVIFNLYVKVRKSIGVRNY